MFSCEWDENVSFHLSIVDSEGISENDSNSARKIQEALAEAYPEKINFILLVLNVEDIISGQLSSHLSSLEDWLKGSSHNNIAVAITNISSVKADAFLRSENQSVREAVTQELRDAIDISVDYNNVFLFENAYSCLSTQAFADIKHIEADNEGSKASIEAHRCREDHYRKNMWEGARLISSAAKRTPTDLEINAKEDLIEGRIVRLHDEMKELHCDAKNHTNAIVEQAENNAKTHASKIVSQLEEESNKNLELRADTLEKKAREFAKEESSNVDKSIRNYVDEKNTKFKEDAETFAKNEAKVKADAAESDAKKYAQEVVDKKAKDIQESCIRYTDTAVSKCEENAKTHADGRAVEAEQNAKTYTDDIQILAGSKVWFRIVNRKTGKCLKAAEGRAIQSRIDGDLRSRPDQFWRWNIKGIVNKDTGESIEIPHGTKDNFAKVDLMHGHHGKHFDWEYNKEHGYLKNIGTSKFLEIPDGNTMSGLDASQYHGWGCHHQRWDLRYP